MSLPAYLFLYDKNGVQIKVSCSTLGREGAYRGNGHTTRNIFINRSSYRLINGCSDA